MNNVTVRYKEFPEQHFSNVVEVVNKNSIIIIVFNNNNKMVIPENNIVSYFIYTITEQPKEEIKETSNA